MFAGGWLRLYSSLPHRTQVFALETAQDSFNIILQIGVVQPPTACRFWWRVTAWCEIVAMVSSFAISVGFLILRKIAVIAPS